MPTARQAQGGDSIPLGARAYSRRRGRDALSARSIVANAADVPRRICRSFFMTERVAMGRATLLRRLPHTESINSCEVELMLLTGANRMRLAAPTSRQTAARVLLRYHSRRQFGTAYRSAGHDRGH